MSSHPSLPRDPADPFTERDHDNMDAFIGFVLDDYAAGEISRDRTANCLQHVMGVLAVGNTGEAKNWFSQGRKFIRA